eukprot:scaffold81109_cov19-Tisochrysis_lutea.AAC.1
MTSESNYFLGSHIVHSQSRGKTGIKQMGKGQGKLSKKDGAGVLCQVFPMRPCATWRSTARSSRRPCPFNV